MVLACQLRARGVAVRLIDGLDKPVTTSRAFTIHARTLELLAQLELASTLCARGHETYSMDYHFPGKDETPRLDFRALDSAHRFCLTINQVDTEAALRERLTELGGSIEWGTRLTSFEVKAEGVVATLSGASGAEQRVETDWLVGCDGIGSTVRKQLQLEFDGSEYTGTMRMIDVEVQGYAEADDAIHYHIAKDHMLLMAKLPGSTHRVLVSDKTEGCPPERAREEFQALLDAHFGGAVTIGEPSWATNFRISKMLTTAFREGRVFLAGDAAHVNSPAGGQGMNVAMQDAFNLGWKLAAVCRGEAPGSLLDTYASERMPVAKQMLEGTSYIHSIIMAHGKGMTERIERMRGGEWNAEAVNQVAGISYTYRAETRGDVVLAVGDRAPDATVGEGRIYDRFGAEGLTLLVMPQVEAARVEALAAQYRGSMTTLVVDDAETTARYGGEGIEVCVVRPDLHLAYRGSLEGLAGVLDSYALPAA